MGIFDAEDFAKAEKLAAEEAKKHDAPIQFDDPAAPAVELAAPFEDASSATPEVRNDEIGVSGPETTSAPPPRKKSAAEIAEEARAAEHHRIREEFFARQKARFAAEEAPPLKPQPIPPGVAEQTRLEMEEGRKQNEKHAQFHRVYPQKAPTPHDQGTVSILKPMVPETNKEVFVPTEYVHEKGEGFEGKGYGKSDGPRL